MHRILHRVLVFIVIVSFCGVYLGCSSSSKKDLPNKTNQHSHGGGCGH